MGAGAQAAGETENLHRPYARGQLELDDQLDLVGEREAALGQRRVPVEAVLGAVDDRLELDADLLTSPKVTVGSVIVPRASIGRSDALDRELAVDDQLAVGRADQRGVEGDVREALGVEEVRRLQVRGEVLVLDGDRVGGDGRR